MSLLYIFIYLFFFFKQKTAYEMRISDWSSDVCSSDLEFNLSYASMLPASNEMLEGRWLDPDRNEVSLEIGLAQTLNIHVNDSLTFDVAEIGRASCRERVCQYV